MDVPTEPSIESAAGAQRGIDVDWLFASPAFAITRWDCSAGQRSISEERVQAWHVIAFVHTGSFVLHTHGRSELIDPTGVLFYNPQDPYRSSHPFGCCDHGSAIVVRRDALLDVQRHYDPKAEERFDAMFTAPCLRGLSRVLLRQILLVHSLDRQEPRDAMALEAAILRMVGETAAESARRRGVERPRIQESSRARRHYVEDAKSLLQERFREKLHLEDIARALYVSTFHLCRLFKEETGMPIHHYLTRLRLREAVEPVLQGNADLGGLALDLGFASHSHFTAAFRKEFGTSPREVRKAGMAGMPELPIP
jgi:AraC-like DNA-binding protein